MGVAPAFSFYTYAYCSCRGPVADGGLNVARRPGATAFFPAVGGQLSNCGANFMSVASVALAALAFSDSQQTTAFLASACDRGRRSVERCIVHRIYGCTA